MIIDTLEESISVLQTYLSKRAYQEGYAAYLAGATRTAIPDRLNVYSGNWVEGWIAAAHDAKATTASSKQASETTFRIPLFDNGLDKLAMNLN